MKAEPLSSEQLAEIEEFAQAVTVAWGQRTPDPRDFLSTAAGHGARIACEHVPLLAAEIGWLAAALADEQAAHEDTAASLAAHQLMAPHLEQRAEKAEAEASALAAELAAARRQLAGREPRS